MALSYYTIVIANIIYSVWFAAWQDFEPVNFDAYKDGLDNNAVQYLIALAVVLASMVISRRGLQKGIERITTLFIPIFVLIGIVMVVSVLRIDGTLLKMQQFLIFMLGWTLVALLSIVCTLDAIIGGLAGLTADRFGRGRWAWVVTIAIAVIMFPIAMNPESIGVLDLIFGSGMFMLGGLLAVLALGWGLGKSVIREQLGQHLSPRMATWLSWWLRFAVPLVLFIILAAYLVSLINP